MQRTTTPSGIGTQALLIMSGVMLALIVPYAPAPYVLGGLALFAAGGIAKALGVPFGVATLLTAMIAELVLGDINIGPFSLRVYLFVILLVAVGVDMGVRRTSLEMDRRVVPLVWIYLAFVLWSGVAELVTGGSPVDVLSYVVTRHAIALSSLILILFYVRTEYHSRVVIGALVGAVVVSAIVAVMQWLGASWAWEIQATLRPLALGPDVDPSILVATGLTASSFLLGYQLATLGPLCLALARRASKRPGLPTILFVLFAATAFVIEQRAALLSLLVLVLVGFRTLLRTTSGGATTLILLIIVIVAGSYVTRDGPSVNPIEESQVGTYDLDRFTDPFDEGRVIVARTAIGFAISNPLFGGGDLFRDLTADSPGAVYTGNSPHNLFLNALVFSGVLGLLLIVLLVVSLVRYMRIAWRTAHERGDWQLRAIVLGLIGYLIVAQFHNASFVTGDTLPWWLIGLLAVRMRQQVGTDDKLSPADAGGRA